MALVKRNEAVIWSNARNGKFQGYLPLGEGRFGSEDATVPGPGRESLYVQDEAGNPLLALAPETPPGGLTNFTINWLEQYDPNAIRAAKSQSRKVAIQQRFHKGGLLTNPTAWRKFYHYGLCAFGDETRSGAQIEYSGSDVRGSVAMTAEIEFEFVRPILTAQTAPAQVADALAVVFISDLIKDIPAYPGPDKIGYIAAQAVAAATANLIVTTNSGSTWANASADPFAADQHIFDVVYKVTNPETGGRVVVINGSGTQIAYADFTWAAPGTLTWTTVSTTGNGKALGWKNFKELLIVTASGVFISENAGVSIARQLSTNTNLTKLAYAPNHPALEPYVYFFGASNTILRKKLGSDTIDTLVGPSGGGAFTALAVALDGTIWAGNGTKLYRSSDGAASAAGWSEVKDFGASKAVVGIGLAKGDSEVLQVVVDNSAPNDGEVWLSADAQTFEPVTNLAQDGYNATYFSPHDVNFVVIAGDDDATRPIVQKLAP